MYVFLIVLYMYILYIQQFQLLSAYDKKANANIKLDDVSQERGPRINSTPSVVP